ERDIEPPEFLYRAIDRRLDVRLARNVGALKYSLATCRGALRDHGFAVLCVEVGQHYCGAFFGESNRGRASHAARRAGNYRDFAVKFAHDCVPRLYRLS